MKHRDDEEAIGAGFMVLRHMLTCVSCRGDQWQSKGRHAQSESGGYGQHQEGIAVNVLQSNYDGTGGCEFASDETSSLWWYERHIGTSTLAEGDGKLQTMRAGNSFVYYWNFL